MLRLKISLIHIDREIEQNRRAIDDRRLFFKVPEPFRMADVSGNQEESRRHKKEGDAHTGNVIKLRHYP